MYVCVYIGDTLVKNVRCVCVRQGESLDRPFHTPSYSQWAALLSNGTIRIHCSNEHLVVVLYS